MTGKVTWAEQDRVLVFVPSSALPYGARVVVTVGPTATSKAGVPLAKAGPGTFKVVAKPAPKPKAPAAPAKKPVTKPINHSGGGGAVSGSWSSVEAYYLRLMNCTRTGGWVTSTGCLLVAGRPLGRPAHAQRGRSAPRCRGRTPSSSPPVGSATTSSGARRATACAVPASRSYRWGENLGCRSGNPFSAVLGSHLFFQSEKPYNGGHYVNLMNAQYDRAGIGVWVSGGRVRLVVDLYHP